MSKNLAIIGAGISGLVSAYLLSKKHRVTLFEANDYIGGHTSTVDVDLANEHHAIDTGFIVFNHKTYPNFCKLLKQLNIQTQKSEMSFSFQSNPLKLVYNGNNLNTMFANRWNVLSPRFYKMIADIVRFNKHAKEFLEQPQDNIFTIIDFIEKHRYRKLFIEAYLFPMISAIWSANPNQISDIPAKFILHFFENHGLLNIQDRPEWMVIKGGSRNYVEPICRHFKSSIHLNTPVHSIERKKEGVVIKTAHDHAQFDEVIIATHSDQALKMIENPHPHEVEVLSAIPYQENEVTLHYDKMVLPKKKLARASWNYHHSNNNVPTLSYYMNRLQSIINTNYDFCVSVNHSDHIDPNKIIEKFKYSHPVFNLSSVQAQKKHALINGKDRLYFCGAYWGYGFHEDGVNSALAACDSFGVGL